MSFLGIIEKRGRWTVVICNGSRCGGIRQLKDMGCVFDGGYVFLPPDGDIIGTYEEVVLPKWFIKILAGRKQKDVV
jgi:hypothetical protein